MLSLFVFVLLSTNYCTATLLLLLQYHCTKTYRLLTIDGMTRLRLEDNVTSEQRSENTNH